MTTIKPVRDLKPCARYYPISGTKNVALAQAFFVLVVVGVAAWVAGYYLAPYGFGTVAVALAITVILAVGWMRTYWKG